MLIVCGEYIFSPNIYEFVFTFIRIIKCAKGDKHMQGVRFTHEYNVLDTVPSILYKWRTLSPNAIVILAEDKDPLTYLQLYSQIRYIVEYLNGIGLGRNNRVATVLPNGPDMAVAFLGISSGFSCAPLNPNLTFSEYEFFLTSMNACALVTQKGVNKAAIEVAEQHDIKSIYLEPIPARASGVFSLSGEKGSRTDIKGIARADDTALILHTSGTTSRPKMVPLSQLNICTSAKNINDTLRLTPDDRCLNVMPLFHIHGLIGALLSSLYAGASIICSSGFIITRFYKWLEKFQPTWYSAVPTMHQRILSRAQVNSDIIKNTRLRLIRSSSAALPSQLMNDLESTFKVPVIESYGMTEAAHQMASNPLPPMMRKAGTVGVPTGPEITILDDVGNELSQGVVGEIAIKGPNVMAGYENNDEANRRSFTYGWFRTGDEGYFDEDNYLVIKGRIKEIINRGGEKVSPREVDEVILEHPHVKQAVTFAIPHPILGEEIGSAIVLEDDKYVSEREIQDHISKRLAVYKIPRRVIFLDEIPKGPTGKIQRIGLSEILDISVTDLDQEIVKYIAPRTPMESLLEDIWSKNLVIQKISVKSNYFQLGGDSILAGQIISEICDKLQIDSIPLVIFLYAPTIEKMANILEEKEFELPPASLVAIQPEGEKTPIYCVHACEGEILFLSPLSQELGPDQPFYGLRAQGLDGKTPSYDSFEDMAKHYLREIQALNPEGPYIFAGAGVGGFVALEMANNIDSESNKVTKLILLDTIITRTRAVNSPKYLIKHFFYLLLRLELRVIIAGIRNRLAILYRQIAQNFIASARIFNEIFEASILYEPKPYNGDTIIFFSEERMDPNFSIEDRIQPWKEILTGQLDIHIVPGKHLSILKKPHVKILAEKIKKKLEKR